MTKTEKLLKALRSGKELTRAQVGKMGIANPSAAIAYLRDKQRISVYSNLRDVKGVAVVKYRIGTPTLAMMAQGYTM
jgi:hypothetical protein